tara:strand:+ start:840 stop:1922 length:1083 start_codon:yes stop_codon:yes gene_type:complete
MSRARDFANLAGSADAGGVTGKNLIINGSCAISQRGASTTGVTSSAYGVDRFNLQLGSIGTYTVSQSSTAPDGFSNSFKIDCTTADASPAAGDYSILTHKVEAQNLQHLGYGTSSAKAMTLSFYLRSNKTGSISLVIRQTDNSNKMFSKQVTITAANTWEKKTVYIPADTSGVINDDNGTGLDVSWWLNAGSTYSGGSEMTTWGTETNANKYLGDLDIGALTTDEFYITGVQLEVGEQATPFEHRSVHDELARCQRYYWQVAGASQIVGQGFYYSTSEFDCIVNLPQTMRAAPTFTPSNNSGDFQVTNISDAFDTWTAQQFFDRSRVNVYVTSGVSGTKGDSGYVRHMNSTSKIQFDAEL